MLFPRRRLITGAAALAVYAHLARAQVPVSHAGKGTPGGGGGAYTGPGDVKSGALAFWGLRAYSSATRGNNCVKLRRDSDNTTSNFSTLTSGLVDTASISSFKGAANLFVDTLFDQTGNGLDMSQSNTTIQPAFTLSVLGSNPAIQPVAANGTTLFTAATTSQAQPVSFSSVVNRTGGIGDGVIIADGSAAVMFFQFQAANTIRIFAGNQFSATETDGTTHSFIVAVNGVSSNIFIDASATSGDAGTDNFSASVLRLFQTGGAHTLTGNFFECGFWGSAFSGTDATNMSSNQHAFWGF